MTRRYFLKLLAFALPALTVLAKLPVVGKSADKWKVAYDDRDRTFFVDSKRGKDYYPGTSPDEAFKTVAHALDKSEVRKTIVLLPPINAKVK